MRRCGGAEDLVRVEMGPGRTAQGRLNASVRHKETERLVASPHGALSPPLPRLAHPQEDLIHIRVVGSPRLDCMSKIAESGREMQSSPMSQQTVMIAVTLNWIGAWRRKKYPVLRRQHSR